MRGNSDVVKQLNLRAIEELSAIHQYAAMASICRNWGYHALADELRRYALMEFHHAEELMERICFLGGVPEVSALEEFPSSTSVPEMLRAFREAEWTAVNRYNETVDLAHRVSDHGTAELIRHILSEEEGHLQWAESLLTQMEHMGLDNLLSVLVGERDEQ